MEKYNLENTTKKKKANLKIQILKIYNIKIICYLQGGRNKTLKKKKNCWQALIKKHFDFLEKKKSQYFLYLSIRVRLFGFSDHVHNKGTQGFLYGWGRYYTEQIYSLFLIEQRQLLSHLCPRWRLVLLWWREKKNWGRKTKKRSWRERREKCNKKIFFFSFVLQCTSKDRCAL